MARLPKKTTEIRDANWQLALKYKSLFSTENGKEILADLEDRFGYHRASCVHGMSPPDAFLNDGMKAPIRHIHWQLNRRPQSEEPLATEAQK